MRFFLSGGLFNLSKSINLKLENIENQWHFVHVEEYEIERMSDDGFDYSSPLVSDSDKSKNDYKLLVDNKHIISIILQQTENSFVIYDHYDISTLNRAITIGRDPHCIIEYDFEEKHLLGSEHATLFKNGNKYYYQDMKSTNGSYINNRRISGSIELQFGDCIDLFGLRMVFWEIILQLMLLKAMPKLIMRS